MILTYHRGYSYKMAAVAQSHSEDPCSVEAVSHCQSSVIKNLHSKSKILLEKNPTWLCLFYKNTQQMPGKVSAVTTVPTGWGRVSASIEVN